MSPSSSPSAPKRATPDSRWAMFVRSARPTALWLMVIGLALQVIVLPVAALANPATAALISEPIARLLAEGIFGLGVFRSIDKWMGKAT